MEIVTLRWIDFIFLILFLFVTYISLVSHLLSGTVKFLGLFVSSFFAFHYYSSWGEIIQEKIPFLPQDYVSFFSFVMIWGMVTLPFFLLRKILELLYKKKVEPSSRERWFSFLLGGARFIFLSSVIFFSLHLLPLEAKYYSQGISYRWFRNFAPGVYMLCYKYIYKKFLPTSTLNKEVESYYEAKKNL